MWNIVLAFKDQQNRYCSYVTLQSSFYNLASIAYVIDKASWVCLIA